MKVCPECDSAHITPRNPGKPQSPATGQKGYSCRDCQHRFADPDEREPKQEQTLTGLPGILERMDKDIVGR